ncbi:hypothetical protein [Streptomyces sp. NPDC053427]|uniref:hypothetical protein n=1 Tax=Streptomyces sp. NPDC053427 TaxID=3365701 RepID=UPI0037D8BE7A
MTVDRGRHGIVGHRIEADGYTAELDDDLDFVFRNRRGRLLKQIPRQLAADAGMDRLRAVRRLLLRQAGDVPPQARRWSAAGRQAPEALAACDPLWRRALDAAGVTLVPEPVRGGLTARTYAHPDDHRTVTHVVEERLAPLRDLVMARYGWALAGTFETGIPEDEQAALPYPERLMAAYPGREEEVLDIALDLDGATWEWQTLPKKDIDAVLEQHGSAPPALLVSFLDEVADRCLKAGETPYAKAYFGRARKTEREAGLKTDQRWLADRYAAYADADALSAAAVRARGRELGVRGGVTAQGAREFLDLLTRQATAYGEVYAQMAADARRVAKAAGLDPEAELAGLLGRIGSHLTLHDHTFWTDVLKGRALELLLAREPGFVRRIVALRPVPHNGPELWLTLLERSGALAQLAGEQPGLPDGEAARWLSGCLWPTAHRRDGRLGVLYELTERLLPRLAADGVPVELPYSARKGRHDTHVPLDLADLLLEHGVPLADPQERLGCFAPRHHLYLHSERRPQLRHLLAEPRFAAELRATLRAELDMTDEFAHNNWYQPHEDKGWREPPGLFATRLGRDVARTWLADELARLRAGVDLEALALLLGRLMLAGAVVDTYLKSAEAAARFASVDITGLLLDELPEGLDRAAAEELLAATQPRHVYRHSTFAEATAVRERLARAYPYAVELPRDAAWALTCAANCRAGLPRIIARLTPGATDGTSATAEQQRPGP